MKKINLLTLFLILAVAAGFGQTTLWSEDFAAYSDNSGYIGPANSTTGDYPASVSKWSLDVSGASLTATTDWFMVNDVSGNLFEGRDLDGEAIWTSEAIDISLYINVSISIDASENGDHEGTDYIRAYYNIDGGGEIMFGEATDDFSSTTFNVTGLSGSSMHITVKMINNAGEEYLRFDNVTVTGTMASGVNNPSNFTAVTASTSQIDLSWTQNGNSNDVMLAWTSDGSFGTPTDGTTYSAGDVITGGGTVIYNGSGTSYNHSSLSSGTQYYYKAWSVDGTTNYSSGITDDATTYKDEPTNHVTTFAAGSPASSSIPLTWTDNDGVVVADGFLIKASTNSTFSDPVDGTANTDDTDMSDGLGMVNIGHATEAYTFTGLNESTTYYFKIWPYTNSGSSIDYKTDGTVPTANETTVAAVSVNAWINEFHYDNSSTDAGEFIEIVIENPGVYTLANMQVDLYNGNDGGSYATHTLDDFIVGNTDGNFTFYYKLISGIQNGPDGFALSYNSSLISGQFISYEGSFTATDGPANGETSTNIGVGEDGGTQIGESLQLKGGGNSYSLFSWQDPASETPGALNNKQYLGDYTRWVGTTDNNWATSGNWNNGVPGSGQNVIVPQGAANYPTISASANCNNLILESNSSGNASLIGVENLTVAGTSTVERYFEAYTGAGDGWHYIGSPVDGMTIENSDFDPTGTNNDLYAWDEDDYLWRNFKGSFFPGSTFQNGLGFMVAYESVVTNSFIGTLNSTDVSFSNLSRTPAKGDGWHLLGNPFASAIYWNDGNWVLSNISGVAKVYDEAGGTYADISANGIIPSTNGFFVQVSDASNAITIPTASRVHDATNNYKNSRSTEMDETLNLIVNNDANNFYDRTTVGFRDDAETSFDWAFDSHKMFGQSTAPQIWTLIEGEEFSTNNLPHVYESLALPMNFKAGVNSTFHILAEGIESFYLNSEIYLEDLQTGNMIDLREQTIYTFDGKPADNNARFVLHFFGITDVSDISVNEDVKVYAYENKIFVKTIEQNINYQIQVFDVMGRKVFTDNFTSNGLDSFSLNVTNGVYVVRIQAGSSVIVDKVYLK